MQLKTNKRADLVYCEFQNAYYFGFIAGRNDRRWCGVSGRIHNSLSVAIVTVTLTISQIPDPVEYGEKSANSDAPDYSGESGGS